MYTSTSHENLAWALTPQTTKHSMFTGLVVLWFTTLPTLEGLNENLAMHIWWWFTKSTTFTKFHGKNSNPV
jgi:hypothetical protein